ncbi:hypothetical protein C8R44DRAFT_385808 [Mycena epipterygia]|nr:hypothetical protein C8R44DRAFT_385808 [Mycena epipterygia]
MSIPAQALKGFSTLPPEILSMIFAHCIPKTSSSYEKFHAPQDSNAPSSKNRSALMLLLHVCRRWRAIAVSTPTLWMVLAVNVENLPEGLLAANTFEPYLQCWFGRAGSLPLSLSLMGNITDKLGRSRISAIIRGHASQLRSLELEIQSGTAEDVIESCDNLPQLRQLTLLGSIPRFLSLPWYQLTKFSGVIQSRSLNPFLRALQLAPNLVECAFANHLANPQHTGDDDPIEVSSHSSLKSLSLSTCSLLLLSPSLTLPALETLKIMNSFGHDLTLLSFLNRSSPPLRVLSTALQVSLHSYRALSHLEDLTLWYLKEQPAVDFLVLLHGKTETILPQLRNLALMGCEFNKAASYGMLFDALASRWHSRLDADGGGLQVFRLDSSLFATPDGEIFDPEHFTMEPVPFATLLAEGMDIHIGSEQENYISLFSRQTSSQSEMT